MSWAENQFKRLSRFEGTPNKPNVMIWMHGLGGHGLPYNMHKPLMQVPDNTVIITPDGPFQLGNKFSFAWFLQIKDDVVRTDMILESTSYLNELVRRLPEFLNFEVGNILLAGYSQGGTMAVTYPFLYPESVHHSACFAGYIANAPEIPITDAVNGTKFWWWHGERDNDNDFYLAEWGVEKLRGIKANLTFIADPNGAHCVYSKSFRDMIKWWGRN